MANAPSAESRLPRLVILEGVDGTGKTTFAERLSSYVRNVAPNVPVYAGSFPGSAPDSLGEWVYRLHHAQLVDLSPDRITPAALQLLHVAAHVDAIETHIAPTLVAGGQVVLDRYWWSTYAYARQRLGARQAWSLVAAEHPFWEDLPRPVIIYLTRRSTLKAGELDQQRHDRLADYYREVIQREQEAGVAILQISNDGGIEESWKAMLAALGLPHRPMG
jgi:thymidylate kinase